uniref:Putative ribonuclease H-like domain-containing protein n=1 Tax=Tanacetum cinerariifolium TaxID=118510 RepID=A0A6L2N2T2_TANCI|nr:putative ribonuclease H-like domain-containing protein [Tanacetum cinerariifolium]
MNKADIEIMIIDDLYNNFKIVKQDVKKSIGTSTGAQNMAFMTASSTSSTNDVNTANPAYEASTVSPNVNTASPQVSTATFSDNDVYAFMVENPNGSNILHHDLKQIHKDDLEAMDLRWQLSLLSMREKRYFQRTRKKIFINANDTVGYDKSKVECFNCHKMGYFARECRAQKNQDGRFRNQDNTRKQGNNKDTSSKAMLTIDGVGFDWSDMAEEQVQTNMALMAFSDSEGKPQKDDKGFIDSGCSRHMTGNIAYLLDFKEFDGATKDETSDILKNFIKEIENLVDKKVKVIRCDNGTEFKNKVMDDFCREKCIKREYSVARTPQVLIVKPHNKTPYELFRGFKSALSFMRPFGCHITILNTLDNLGKYDGKSDEGFFVRYSLSNKAFRVYNTRTRKDVEDDPHNEDDDKDKFKDDSSPKEVNAAGQHVNIASLEVNTASDTLKATHVEFFSDRDAPEVFRNKKDERGIVIRNKARLVAQCHRQEEGIDYEEVFDHVARIKAIRLFLAYASFMGFLVYQMDVKSAFLYETIEEEVNVTQPLGYKDPDHLDKVYKVVKALYGLHQALRAYDNIGANQDRKSTTRGCQFLGNRLISWQCKKQTVVATSTTKAEYVAATSCDEAVHKELGDRMEMAATTASSLEAEQDSGSGLRCQDTILGDVEAQTRLEAASKQFNDPPLSRVNTLRCEEDIIKLKELIDLFIYVSLIRQFWETASSSTSKNGEIKITATIDRRVKYVTEASIRRYLKLEDSEDISNLPNTEIFEQLALMGSNTPGSEEGRMTLNELTDLCTSLSNKVESLESDLKQIKLIYGAAYSKLIMKGRKIAQINEDEGITLVQMGAQTQGRNEHEVEFDFDFTTAKDISTANVPVTTAGAEISIASPEDKTAETSDDSDDITLAETLIEIRRSATKPQKVDIVQKERQNQEEATIAILTEEFNEIQARIDVDHELAARLTYEEQEQFTIEERAKLLAEFFERRKKQLAAERSEAIRNKPPTRTQVKNRMITYLKHIEPRWIDDFKHMDDDSQQQVESSKKRQREVSDKESSKKQKLEENNDAKKEELRVILDIVPSDDIAINVESLATKYPIVDWKTYILTENMMHYQIIRADGSSKLQNI